MIKKLQNLLIFKTLTILSLGFSSKSYAVACNWKSNNPTVLTWDSCKSGSGYAALNGYVYFNSNIQSCFKYTWKINGNVVATGRTLYKKITQNGTYNICLTVVDTCNKCDTTFCATKNISCFGNTCNWKNRNLSFYAWDSCKNNSSANLNGEINFNYNQSGCLRYAWTVNGAAASNTRVMHKSITQNGTYNICVKVTDTCNKCDTTICTTKTISCFNNSCNWKNRNPFVFTWDSCKNNSSANVNGYISFQSNTSCFKYSWTVNGVASGTGYIMNKNITQNGTYNICVKVTDTCNKCDTTFCSTKTISCFTNSCNWKNRKPYMFTWDSCKNNSSANVNGYISFQNNTSCFKYNWTVNGVAAGTGYIMHKNITQNGTYNICVKVTDTCNKCDTTFCSTKTISCFGNKCVWKNKIAAINFFDSCNGIRYRNSTTGYIAMNQNSNNSCLKFIWKVDSQIVSNTYFFTAPIIRNGYHTYCVKITDTCNKCDTVICQSRYYHCNNLSINSEFTKETIFVYPLPAKQYLSIYSGYENSKAFIYTINGISIWNGTIIEGENIIKTENWPSGMYILNIQTTDGIITKKILKE